MHRRCYLLFVVLIFGTRPIQAHSDSLLFAGSQYYPHYAEDLPHQGAVSEIIRQAFLSQGIEITIEFMPFARAYRESQQAKYVGLIGAWYDKERTQHFYYSQPLYANQIVFFKRKAERIVFRDYHDLAQQRLRLAMVQGYLPPEGLLDNQPNVVQVAQDEQALQMLAKGRVDLVPADKLNGLYLISSKPQQYPVELDWMTPVLENRPMYLLLSKKDPRADVLLRQFNHGLSELRQNGQYQQIINTLLSTSQQP